MLYSNQEALCQVTMVTAHSNHGAGECPKTDDLIGQLPDHMTYSGKVTGFSHMHFVPKQLTSRVELASHMTGVSTSMMSLRAEPA